MRPQTRHAILLLALVTILGLHWSLRPDPTRRNVEIMPEMVRAVPAETFAPSPVFGDGKTLQQPVPGTIPRGWPAFRFEATRLDALLAGQQLTNPFSSDDETAVRRGEFVYTTFCATCHGPAGNGDGPVTLRGYPPPPSFDTPLSRRMRDGQMYHIITLGRDNMAGMASRIPREDRWKAVLHVRALQARVEEAPPPETTDAPAVETVVSSLEVQP